MNVREEREKVTEGAIFLECCDFLNNLYLTGDVQF